MAKKDFKITAAALRRAADDRSYKKGEDYFQRGLVRSLLADSDEIVAKTTSGIVQFTGKLHQDGHYEFESFSGEVVLVLPPESNFTLSAKTHSGSVNTEFPLQLTRTIGGSLMTGTVGKGGADVRASSFSGSVRIKKATR